MQILKSRSIAFILAFMITVLFIPVPSYAADDEVADDIKYTVKAGDEADFDEDDFYDACEDFIGNDDLNYVQFSLPSSTKGILYFDSDDKVKESYTFGDDGDEGSIDDVYFAADDDYSGTVSISYEGVYDDDMDFSGKVIITVKDDDDADEITYSVDSDDTVDFEKEDFANVCEDETNGDLDYVNFTPPASSKGILYYLYDEDDQKKVSKSTDYSYKDIDDITFVPDEDYSGTVTISYKGYDEDDDSFTGTVEIEVEDGGSQSGDINYSVDADDELEFDEDDFNEFCDDENDEELDFITFTLPSSSKGILYYDYDGDDEKKIKSTEKYYYDKNPSIDDITFVPDEDYSGYCKIEFEGDDEDGDSIEGTIVISVANEDLVADLIYLTGTAGTPILMQEVYFNKECQEVLDDTLDYVKFTLPAASNGTLYYNYTTASASSKVSASTKYYYDDKSPYINKVSFVSAGTGAGTYTLKYTGYDTDGSSFTGEVKITAAVKAAGSGTGSSSLYFSDVKDNYSWAILYVDTLYSTSVITGTTASDGTMRFNPGTSITRGDFMLYLCKALNLSSATASGNFSDVPAGSYYYDAISVAKALGIAQGTNNKFYPNSTITREDAMALALRAMNVSGNSVGVGSISDLNKFTDNASVSSYAKEAIAAMIKAGIINGSDGKINPKSTITRAESSAMIYRIKY